MIILSACLLASLHGVPPGPAINNPYRYYNHVLKWDQVWDGSDWKWTPADVCPVCSGHVKPIELSWPSNHILCPHCGAVIDEVDWDKFNIKRAWLISWPDAHKGKHNHAGNY